MNDGDEKFALEYHTAEDTDPEGPPFKYRSHYLDDAVAEAWRIIEADGRVLCVTRGGEVTLDIEALERVLSLVRETRAGDPERPVREIAAQALGENAKSQSA